MMRRTVSPSKVPVRRLLSEGFGTHGRRTSGASDCGGVSRFTVLVSLAALGFASGAGASSTVYGPRGTAACMRAAGADVDRAPAIVSETFPEIRSAIYWHLGITKTINVMFTRNARDGVKLAEGLRRTAYSVGLTTAEVGSTVKQLGNAVWTNDDFPGPTDRQNDLIERCLR
jgi:hypothetical protein